MSDAPVHALAVVERLADAAQRALPPTAVLECVCAEVAAAFGLDRVVAALHDAESEAVRVVAGHGVAGEPLGRSVRLEDVPLLARSCAARDLVFATDASEAEPLSLTSPFALPLLAGGECIAFLAGERSGDGSLTEPQRRALRTIAVVAATTVHSALVAERRRDFDAARTQFIALAAHELRTPVAVMYGITSTLVGRGSHLAGDQLVELRTTLHAQTSRLRLLVEQLLDLSRIDAHALSIRPQRLRVRNRVEELVLLLAEQRASEVALAVPPQLEAELDAVALDRIVSNLLTNALKYGAPPITISATRHDRHFRLAVEDRGPGVADEFVQRLFDRFSRSGAADPGVPGSGLGLAIARSYANAHGGELLYAPAEPHGARFEVVIPVGER